MGTLTLKHVQKEVENLRLKTWLRHSLSKTDWTMRKLSRALGMNEAYLHQVATKGDFTGAQLVAIGKYLDLNPFEPYIHLLGSRHCRTKLEKAQATTITELEEKIAALEKERDWLKEVVMKR